MNKEYITTEYVCRLLDKKNISNEEWRYTMVVLSQHNNYLSQQLQQNRKN